MRERMAAGQSDSLPSAAEANEPSSGRLRTTPKERTLLRSVFPRYDDLDPLSDERKQLTSQLLQTLLIGSALWTSDRITQWMRNEKRNCRDRRLPMSREEFTVASGHLEDRTDQLRVTLVNISDRLSRLETSADLRIKELASNLQTATATQQSDIAAIRAQATSVRDSIDQLSSTLQTQFNQMAQRIPPPTVSGQFAGQIPRASAQASRPAVGTSDTAPSTPLRSIAHRATHFRAPQVADILERTTRGSAARP
jgi:hypothetical protein